MSEAAHVNGQSLADGAPEAPATAVEVNGSQLNGHAVQQDVEMADGLAHQADAAIEGTIHPLAPQPTPASTAQPASLAPYSEAQSHSPMPPTTSTPGATGSATRASTPGTAPAPGALPPSAIIPPANPHGSPTRVYINQKITPSLLEGMKQVATNEPEKPLKWLAEFLMKKSQELEGP